MPAVTATPAGTGAPTERQAPARQELRQVAVGLITLLAAVVGATAPVDPTAVPAVDAVLAAVLAGTLAYCASRAHRWSWYPAAAVAAGLGEAPWVLAGALALALAVAASWSSHRIRPVGAAIGGLAAQSLLRLDDWGSFGVTALIVAVVTVPLVFSGLRRSPKRVRRTAGVTLIAAAVVGSVLTVLAVVVAIGQRGAVEDGIDAAESGLAAAESGDDTVAVELLGDAVESFRSAESALGASWLSPVKAVPVVGQHVDALEVVSGEGAQLARLAAEAVEDADVDALTFDDGVIDVDALRDVEPPLSRSAAGLVDAERAVRDISADWLVSPVRSRVDRFSDQVTDASADAEVALDAVRIAPGLFGGDQDRRYLVLFTTTSEMRGLGGFIGNFGELTAVDGNVELTRSGRLTRDVGRRPGEPSYEISGPTDYLARYGQWDPGFFIQDTTFSPDFPSVGTVWEELYPQVPGGGSLDGVIMVDPVGLAGLLEFTGPILVDGLDVALTADNAADILLRDQYLVFPEDDADRIDFLDEASRKTFEALTSGDLPGPQQVIDTLGPLVRDGHLAVHSVHEDEQELYLSTGIAGELPPVAGEFAALTGQNAGNSKIDIFSRRAIDYDAVVDPSRGTVEATVTIELANDAPASGLPSDVLRNRFEDQVPGTRSTNLSWYSTLRLESMTVDDFPATVDVGRERGRNAYSRIVHIPPGETRSVVIKLSGTYAGGDRFRLDVASQPTVQPDRLMVSVRGAEGWRVVGARGAEVAEGAARLDQDLTEDLVLEVELESDEGG